MKPQWIAPLLLLGILIIPAMGHAGTSCPWLNQATAAGALGGSASLRVQSTTAAGESCLFQYQKETTIYDLLIVIQKADPSIRGMISASSRCRSKVIPLKGIGNEATMCVVDFNSFHGECVTGRVRDQKFVVRLVSSMNKDSTRADEMLQLKAKVIAEQVAGSLF